MSKVSVSCRIRGVAAPSNDGNNAENNDPNTSSAPNANSIIDKQDDKVLQLKTADGSALTFEFDHIFGDQCTQVELFDELVRPIVEDALRGFNATIFTYGQTGSGKTYTMEGAKAPTSKQVASGSGGAMTAETLSTLKGITPRSVDHIFGHLDALKEQALQVAKGGPTALPDEASAAPTPPPYFLQSYEVRLSIMQIYQEKLYDLLVVPGANGASADIAANNSLRIREHNSSSTSSGKPSAAVTALTATGSTIWVEGLTEHILASAAQFDGFMTSAARRRAVGGHNLNTESSRSHLITILTVRQQVRRPKEDDAGGGAGAPNVAKRGKAAVAAAAVERLYSKIYLVDLAGSEMAKRTGASGQRLEEAKYINKSLSALGNVICALTPPPPGQGGGGGGAAAEGTSAAAVAAAGLHVPYRDSKLTRILQDSLGGNAKTALILTVSAARSHMTETVATLRFGERARQLRTKPRLNVETGEASLKKALAAAREKIRTMGVTVSALGFEVSELKEANAGLLASLATAEEEKKKALQELAKAKKQGVATDAPGDSVLCSACSKPVDLSENVAVVETEVTKPPKHQTPKPSVESAKNPAAKAAGAAKVKKIPSAGGASPKPMASKPMKSKALGQTATVTPSPEPDPEPEQEREPTPVAELSSDVEPEPQPEPEPEAEKEEDEEEEDDPSNRCAVCGLTIEESDVLVRDTGEYLGEMFACDGNCGCKYHVKCAGVIGEGGQYALPEGEWFCTLCTANMYGGGGGAGAGDVGLGSSFDGLGFGMGGRRRRGGDGDEMEEDDDEEEPIVGYSSIADVNTLKVQNSGLGLGLGAEDDEGSIVSFANSMGLETSANSGSNSSTGLPLPRDQQQLMHKAVSDYNLMRRERNRILTQWQHEKKISAMLDSNRTAMLRSKDREFTEMKAEVDATNALYADECAVRARLEKQNAELWQLLSELSAAATAGGVAAGGVGGSGQKASPQQQALLKKAAERHRASSGLTTTGDGGGQQGEGMLTSPISASETGKGGGVDGALSGASLWFTSASSSPQVTDEGTVGADDGSRNIATAVERRRRKRAAAAAAAGAPTESADSSAATVGHDSPQGASSAAVTGRRNRGQAAGAVTDSGLLDGDIQSKPKESGDTHIVMPKLMRRNNSISPVVGTGNGGLGAPTSTGSSFRSTDGVGTGDSLDRTLTGDQSSGGREGDASGMSIPKPWKVKSSRSIGAFVADADNSSGADSSGQVLGQGLLLKSMINESGRRLLGATTGASLNGDTARSGGGNGSTDAKVLLSSSLSRLHDAGGNSPKISMGVGYSSGGDSDEEDDVRTRGSAKKTPLHGTIKLRGHLNSSPIQSHLGDRMQQEKGPTSSKTSDGEGVLSKKASARAAAAATNERINALLTSVQAEMGSFVEIREKYVGKTDPGAASGAPVGRVAPTEAPPTEGGAAARAAARERRKRKEDDAGRAEREL